MRVCWFSGGVSSFVAAYFERHRLDKVIYTHIDDQHPDTLRFLHDCEKILQRPIEVLQSPYRSVNNVIRAFGFINSAYGAKCTDVLKKRVRKEWENGRRDLTYVWGFDASEQRRADDLQATMPKQKHIFPLIEHNFLKEDCHGLLAYIGIKRPLMYDLGYQNNNCVGCVKGGMGYWNRIRADFPDIFAQRASQEREIGHTCIKGIYLDELEPDRGHFTDDIPQDCDLLCQIYAGER
jgi:hypothetical protein